MNSEIQILKKIWENEGESHIKSIYSQTGFGLDYIRYVCNCLIKKGKIMAVKNNRDLYRITSIGKKELMMFGIIKPQVLPWVRNTKNKEIKIKKPKSDMIQPEEKKINLGRNFTKTISFLKHRFKNDKK
ncbi:MAG: hypothetical protein ABIC82_05465 [bacterium]